MGDLVRMPRLPYCHFEKPLFNLGIYSGVIIPGVLRWCRISSIHSIGSSQPQNHGRVRQIRRLACSPNLQCLGHHRVSTASRIVSGVDELWLTEIQNPPTWISVFLVGFLCATNMVTRQKKHTHNMGMRQNVVPHQTTAGFHLPTGQPILVACF